MSGSTNEQATAVSVRQLPGAVYDQPACVGAMSTDCGRAIEWDGKVLTGWVVVNGVATKVTADRATIHACAAGFSDALTWEIDRFRTEILEKLMPFFCRQNS